jgi:hypothetical protein
MKSAGSIAGARRALALVMELKCGPCATHPKTNAFFAKYGHADIFPAALALYSASVVAALRRHFPPELGTP